MRTTPLEKALYGMSFAIRNFSVSKRRCTFLSEVLPSLLSSASWRLLTAVSCCSMRSSACLLVLEVMIAYERGTQNSPEGLGKNLSHAFTLTFEDESQRDQYLTHPLHLQFIQSHVEGNLDSVTVFDYDILHGV